MTKEDVVQIDSPVGYKGRAILNPFAKQVLEGTQPRPRTCDNCLKQCSRSFCIIRALTRAQQGDVETGLVFTGEYVEDQRNFTRERNFQKTERRNSKNLI